MYILFIHEYYIHTCILCSYIHYFHTYTYRCNHTHLYLNMHVDICIVHKLYVHIDISAEPCCSGGVRERSNFCQAIRKDMLGLKLASKQFRKQRLALWAAGRGPDPSFTAMVFWPCEGVLCPELCRMKVGRQSQGCVLALRGGPWPGAVQDES